VFTSNSHNVTEEDGEDDLMHATHHSFVAVDIDEPETPKKVKSIIVKVENSKRHVSTHEVEAEFSARQVKSRFARKRHSDSPSTPVRITNSFERSSSASTRKDSPSDVEIEMETNEKDLNFLNKTLKYYPTAFNSNFPKKK
jgi:hypothetical protein